MKKEVPRCISAANRIINRTNAQNAWRYQLGKQKVKLTGKRLQKILYLCQLFWYTDHEESNMIPENFVAWPQGPIIPEIYDYFLVYQEGDMYPRQEANYNLTEEESDLINKVVDNTIDLSDEEIIEYTKSPNGPWSQAYKGYQKVFSIISKESIKQYIQNQEVQNELLDFVLSKVECEEHILTMKQ